MATATKNTAKATKATKVTTINAGGGIMVDVVEPTKATAKAKAVKAAAQKAAAKPTTAKAAGTVKAVKEAPKAAEKVSSTNPYREGGGYWATVEALRALGVGKLHALDKVVPAVIRAYGPERFKAFKAKDARNENGKDANARIIQNVAVVARNDYGEPLRKLGWEVRFDGREKVAGLFKLGK